MTRPSRKHRALERELANLVAASTIFVQAVESAVPVFRRAKVPPEALGDLETIRARARHQHAVIDALTVLLNGEGPVF